TPRQRFVVSGHEVHLVGELFYVHDQGSGAPRLVEYIDYAAEQVRRVAPDAERLRLQWAQAPVRQEIESALAERGIQLDELVRLTGLENVDAFDVLAHVAWRLAPETRSDRARRVREGEVGELAGYAEPAREVLGALLERYTEFGIEDVTDPHVLQLPPLRGLGSPADLARRFGGPAALHDAVDALQTWLYSA
ncbi:MAG: type restriction-modification system, subunit, partial [Microbacteriaceae bacterium]|nr:type restriction-modification system, subunit [Microbacteriaceae bacterium]